MATKEDVLVAQHLNAGYGSLIIQNDLNFSIKQGEVFIIMGGSGCGKSTLLRHLIGLQPPLAGKILYKGQDYWANNSDQRSLLQQNFGVLYQNGALWGSMTLLDNICLPIETWRPKVSKAERVELAKMKLSLVGLTGCENLYPSQLSGGMRKRAALARALALDPHVLFFDEPSAGLDPLSAAALDDLILQLRDSLGASIVLVTHELPSIYTVADTCLFLDNKTRTQIALGSLDELLNHGPDVVRSFLRRGKSSKALEKIL